MTFSGRQDFLIITRTIQRLFERDSCFFILEKGCETALNARNKGNRIFRCILKKFEGPTGTPALRLFPGPSNHFDVTC